MPHKYRPKIRVKGATKTFSSVASLKRYLKNQKRVTAKSR
jgi:hypothetical protein